MNVRALFLGGSPPVAVKTRRLVIETHEVVDLLREGQLALVVCVRCGATWNEGEVPMPGFCR